MLGLAPATSATPMRVRAVQQFTDENGHHEVGAELDMVPAVAAIRIRDGLCVPSRGDTEAAVVPEETEKATLLQPVRPRKAPKTARGK